MLKLAVTKIQFQSIIDNIHGSTNHNSDPESHAMSHDSYHVTNSSRDSFKKNLGKVQTEVALDSSPRKNGKTTESGPIEGN